MLLINCIYRHLKKCGEQTAIIWEGDNPYDDKKIVYNELYELASLSARQCDEEVWRQEGDRVTIYMPMILEVCC